MTNSTISGNHTDGNGGGVYTYDAIDAINSTVSGNSAGLSGGGVWIRGGISAVVNSAIDESKFYNNRALANGGSIFLQAGTLYLNQTIVSTAPQGLLGSAIVPGFSLIGDNVGSGLAEAPVGSPDVNGNLIGGSAYGHQIDPELGPLAYNGGPMFLDGSRMLTHALLAGSPAIDAGDPAAMAGVGGVPVNDERGAPFSRVFGGRIDIGAVESQPNPLVGDYNFDGVVDSADYSVWRDTLGATNDLRADGNGDRVVNQLDCDVWKAHFGQALAGAGSGSGAFVASDMPQGVLEDHAAGQASSGTQVGAAAISAQLLKASSIDPLPVQRTIFDRALRALFRASARRDLLFEAWAAANAGPPRASRDSAAGRWRRDAETEDLPRDSTAAVDGVFALVGSAI